MDIRIKIMNLLELVERRLNNQLNPVLHYDQKLKSYMSLQDVKMFSTSSTSLSIKANRRASG